MSDSSARKRPPPPPPPQRRRQASAHLPPPRSAALSADRKQSLALEAAGLLNEQLQARIVHYRGDLETSPELDAITAQVVGQLRAIQSSVPHDPSQRAAPKQIEAAQIQTMCGLLQRILDPTRGSTWVAQVLKPIGRRVAKLFFESELHDRTAEDRDRRIFHAEQGVYYVLQRYRQQLRADLDRFEYVNKDIRELTMATLEKIERDLQVAFLSRRSPELNRIMTLFMQVVTAFLQQHLPPRLEQMVRVAIRSAGCARHPNSVAHKVQSEHFRALRVAWERVLVQQIVNFCGDDLMARLEQTDERFSDETIGLFTDPLIFAETCGVLCESLYDYLCLEGFLDLPVDWRVTLSARPPA